MLTHTHAHAQTHCCVGHCVILLVFSLYYYNCLRSVEVSDRSLRTGDPGGRDLVVLDTGCIANHITVYDLLLRLFQDAVSTACVIERRV